MHALKSLAIVTPWFGQDLVGGAEQQAFQIAIRMAQRGHAVTVLTTCCRSFQEDWSTNHLPAGPSEEHGVTVRRFPVDQRNRAAFDDLNARLLSLPSRSRRTGVASLTTADLEGFTKDNINSKALLNYLGSHQEDFEAVIFIPYMFGVILQGLPLVSAKAFLQPCLHDEAYAYLPAVENMFRLARGLLFNSQGEAQLANSIFGPGIIRRSVVVGEGIEPVSSAESQYPRDLQDTRYILYLGRRDPAKNIDLLIASFLQFKKHSPDSEIKLVLAGPGLTSFGSPAHDILDVGQVSESEKAALLKNCLALFQPSTNESYSRVMMEAWSFGRPVVVNGDCMATATSVLECRGGWTATTESEWAEVFARMDSLSLSDELNAAGQRGARYAEANADWNSVIDRYETALTARSVDSKPIRKLSSIHQLLPDLSFADAISNHALAIRGRLRYLGYDSEIFVKNLDARVEQDGKRFSEGCIDRDAGVIYHHSIGTDLTNYAIKHLGPKLLIYHNITPSHFFKAYRPGFAWMLEKGRDDLNRLAKFFPLSVGDSAFNAAELTANNLPDPGVLPIIVDPDKWNATPDFELMSRLADGTINILFVGRVAPNKMQGQLVEAFAEFRSMVPNSRLIVVGDGRDFDPYYQSVLETITRLDLAHHVIIAGQTSEAELQTYYRTAHLYWSMSEHEGFCVPIVEAMWFDVPVLAYNATAVPETLADAGMLFTSKADLASVATMARDLVSNEQLRREVIAVQRQRRQSFLPEAVWPKLDELLEQLETYNEVRLRQELKSA